MLETKIFIMQITAKALAQLLNATIEGNPDVIITHPARIEEGDEGGISFLANDKYESYVYTTNVSAILVSKDFVPKKPIKATLIRVENVRMSVTFLLEQFNKLQQKKPTGIHELAFIHPTAKLGDNVEVGAFSYIGENVVLGNNVKLREQVFVGDNVRIGTDVTCLAGVKIFHDCVIGDHCFFHAHAIVGSDGFGFAPQKDGTFKKVPQLGNVVIGNHVDVGANTVIDRATMGSTVIKDGVKLDNLIQIAHNVEIGENTVIAAQAGIAGSTKVGKNCMIGGQVGIVGHIVIADGSKIQAQSGIAGSLKKPDKAWYGSPAIDYMNYQRSHIIFKQLPQLEKRVRMLEKQLKAFSSMNTNKDT